MRKFIYSLLIICSFFFCFKDVYASTNTYNREEKANLGVNKKWKIDTSNKNNVLNTPYVDASEKIYDYSDILTESEEQILYNKIQEFISKTKIDLVFVTVDMPYYGDQENEEYAADFYDYNDFGIDTEHYDGVLLLRNTYSTDPYYNIYTFGNAQLYFPFERCESILDNIYNNFVSHNYLVGFETVITNLNSYYDSGIPSEYRNYYIDDMGYLQKKYTYPFLIILPVSIGITAIIISILVSKNKMIKKATRAEEYLDSKSIGFSKRCDKFIRTHTSSYRISSSSSGGGGHSSRSGSSGGGHGGGGGRHG